MIVCNGCSKSGTHFLTSLMKAMGKTQLGGTLIKRPEKPLYITSETPLKTYLEADDDHFVHAHLIWRAPLAERLAAHRHLFVIRNPRNIALSWMRHRKRQDPDLTESAETLERIVRGGMFGHSVPAFIDLHRGWLDDAHVCAVRFEDLVARDAASLTRIALHVGALPDPAQYERAFGEGSTYTAKLSDWSDSPYWTEAVETAWRDSGGPQVSEALGYPA